MLIACEKCATTYVLDERLIPAAGAPVQCTRCGHVFTAKPGGGASAGPTPAPEPAAARSTMMFGAAGGPEKKTNQTMMFGAAGLDAPTPPPANAPTHRTVMFGAGQVETKPAAAPVNKNATMMFGATHTPAAAPPPPAANAPTNQTMMFGAVGGPPGPAAGAAAAAPRASSQTMMFGAGGAALPPAPPKPAPAPAPASSSNRTMMFGVPTADKPNVEPAAPVNRTMIFGAAEAEGNPGKLTERTVRIGPEDLERMMREHNARGGGDARGAEMTPPEGAVQAGASQKTQMFAMSDIKPAADVTPSEGREAVQQRHDRTAMFAMTPEAPALPPLISPDDVAPVEKSNVKLDPSLLETLPPNAGKDDGAPRVAATMIFGAGQGSRPQGPVPELATNPDLIATTMPNLPPLPKEPRPLPPQQLDLQQPEDQQLAAPSDDVAQKLQAQVKRRNRIAMIIVILAIAAAAVAVGWKLFGAKLMGTAVPLEAMQGVESGLAELLKDDTASKAAAAKALAAVVKKQPNFVDAHAGLVTALTLQLDDLQQRAKRLDQSANERNARITRYNKEKTPDWEKNAAALANEVVAIKKDYDPLVASARELEARLREAYKAMQVAASQSGELNRQAELALIRAQALYHAYGGTDEALKLSKRYQSKADGRSDGWIDLVDAEYAANTRSSPELIESAQKQLTALHERDPTFFRTYILSARLYLQAKKYEEAEAELQTVLSMKPQHDIANELSEWAKKAQADDAKRKKDPPPPQ